MAKENILEALGDIAREKGIERGKLVTVVQEAITAAAKRKFRHYEDIDARISPDTGELEVFRYKRVAEEVEDPENEISLEEARRLDQLAEPGDEVEYEIDNKEVSRVIAQTARQLIFQKIREAERETIVENFKDRVGEVLNGIVSRTERGRTFITFNQTEAILYRREQIPHERYAPGDHIRVILLDVLNDPREPSQLVISRAHPLLLTKLFEMEVPEIYDGVVEIVTAAREPGRRAKVAVRSHDMDVDPVGACVGLRGSRVQSIIAELRGEKIDIIHYSEDLLTYVANSLAPAELNRIKINEEEKEIDVEVEPDQLSLAIGRQGQNVRLASKLLGYRINIRSTSESAPSLEEQIRQRLLASQAEMGIGVSDAGTGLTPPVDETGQPLTGEGEAPAGERPYGADEGPPQETPAGMAEGETPPPVPESEPLQPAAEPGLSHEPSVAGAEAAGTPPADAGVPEAESLADQPEEVHAGVPGPDAPPAASEVHAAGAQAATPHVHTEDAPEGTRPGELQGLEAREEEREPPQPLEGEAVGTTEDLPGATYGTPAEAVTPAETGSEPAGAEEEGGAESATGEQPPPEARKEAEMMWEGAPAAPHEEHDPTEEHAPAAHTGDAKAGTDT